MEEFRQAALAELIDSPLNPRRHYDAKKIEELAESIRGVGGIIEPLVVRPKADHLEIITGSRRRRAAKLAELATVPVLVRDLSDAEALEIMVVENNQREGVNPLEEAEGYHRLIKLGHSLDRLAEKIGRSPKYVYDRLKLLDLIGEAKDHVLAGRITAGHAILLARLKPADQKRAIDVDAGGLFEGEDLLFNPNEDGTAQPKLSKTEAKYHELKARSVRELEGWIDEHVRFDRDAPIAADLFPATARAVAEAKEQRVKVVEITHDHYVQPDSKEGNTERIFTARTWKPADGSAKSCEKSVTGVIVVGPERGTAKTVCVNKDCKTHWGAERRERARQQLRGGGSGQSAAAEEAKRKAEQQSEEQQRKAFENAMPALITACVERVKTAKFGELAQLLYFNAWHLKNALKHYPKPRTIEDLARLTAFSEVFAVCTPYNVRQFSKAAKFIGVDVKKFITPQPAPAVGAADMKARKK